VPDPDAARALKFSAIHDALKAIAEADGLRIITWW
jgi:hypothetical protein